MVGLDCNIQGFRISRQSTGICAVLTTLEYFCVTESLQRNMIKSFSCQVCVGDQRAVGDSRTYCSTLITPLMPDSTPFKATDYLAHSGPGRSLNSHVRGEIIFSQGAAADAIYYLQKGRVKISVVSNSGKEAVIAILTPHGFFGEGCLGGQTRRMASAIAISDCTTMRLEKASVLQTLASEPAFSELLLSYMLTRSIRVEEDLVDQLFNSSEKRLARALLLLANFGKEGNPETVIPRISQETLAEMIGTTRSRVSFFMNKFRKLGFIRYGDGSDTLGAGTLEVHSSLLNVVLRD